MLFRLTLETERSDDSWWQRPSALRALSYALLHLGDPALASEIHAQDGVKPFTIAAWADRQMIQMQFTGLTEGAARALTVGISQRDEGTPVRFGKTEIVLRYAGSKQKSCRYMATYGDLAGATFHPRVGLIFSTPTAFSQGGDLHLPLPVPEMMLRSWARRWNAFRPTGLEALEIDEQTLARIVSHIGLAQARIETVTVNLTPGKLIGFVGEITLEALNSRDWPEGDKQVFATLTGYSAFAGTGVRTAQGMGLTFLKEHV